MTGVELKDALADLEITQIEFAQCIGVHTITVSNWARGANNKDTIPRYVEFIIQLLRERAKYQPRRVAA